MSTVAEVLNYCKKKLPEHQDLYPYLNEAVRLVAKRLFINRSSLIKADFSQAVTSGESSVTMPSDFWGLVENPYEDGKTFKLEPLPNRTTQLNYSSTGTPQWFEMQGLSTMTIIPATSSTTTINGKYFQKPAELTKDTDIMPYNELFDTVIQQLILMQFKDGSDMAGLEDYATQKVNELAQKTDKTQPARMINRSGFRQRLNSRYH